MLRSSYFKTEDGNIGGIYTPLDWDMGTGWKNDWDSFMFNLNTSRIEVRTKRDDIDLSEIMSKFYNGGGHCKSAGGVLPVTPDVIKLCLANLGTIVSIQRQKK